MFVSVLTSRLQFGQIITSSQIVSRRLKFIIQPRSDQLRFPFDSPRSTRRAAGLLHSPFLFSWSGIDTIAPIARLMGISA